MNKHRKPTENAPLALPTVGDGNPPTDFNALFSRIVVDLVSRTFADNLTRAQNDAVALVDAAAEQTQAQLATQSENLAQARRELTTVRQEVGTTRSDLASVRGEVKAVGPALAVVRDEVRTITEALSGARAEIGAVQAEVGPLGEALTRTEGELRRELAEVDTRLTAGLMGVDSLRAAIAVRLGEIAAEVARYSRANEALGERVVAAIEECRGQAAGVETEVAAVRAALAAGQEADAGILEALKEVRTILARDDDTHALLAESVRSLSRGCDTLADRLFRLETATDCRSGGFLSRIGRWFGRRLGRPTALLSPC
jgi:septal ring factor EnvC (AmiA/AmiB activator)